jgi:hypothetical protein
MMKFFNYFPGIAPLQFPLLVSGMILFVVMLLIATNSITFGQISPENKIQTWTDNLSNVEVQFTHSPEKPVIDEPTELRFNVVNLSNNSPLKNFHASVVVLTNTAEQVRSFKFSNITAPTGNFSVKYLFPDSGSFQVVSRIDSNVSTTLASFNVLVSLSQMGAGLGFLNPIVLSALVISIIVIVIVIYFIFRKRKRKTQ